MTGAGLHGRAWPWFVGAGAVYLGTLLGTWWPRTGPKEVNLIPFRPHLQDLRRGAWTPEARRARCDLAINVVLLRPAAFLLDQGFRRTRGARVEKQVIGRPVQRPALRWLTVTQEIASRSRPVRMNPC
jgi:hypothetical protein